MTIRIFIGCAPNNEDLESQSVCEFSIRKHTTREIEITWMQLSRDPASPFYSDGPHGWQTAFWTTPFSALRWCVPELCGWQGQAIYTDSDVIFRADIGELWDQPFEPGKVVIAKGGNHGRHGKLFCVSKWDCARARWLLPPMYRIQHDPMSHRVLMQKFSAMPDVVQSFAGGDWNAVDTEPLDLADPNVKAVHYTAIPTQVQLKHALPRLAREGGRHWYPGPARRHPVPELQRLFDQLLAEATAAGCGIERYRRELFGVYQIRAGR